ncbi:hypothetical protein FA13DRAFT_1721909, partial [Coprinellus micaceus]
MASPPFRLDSLDAQQWTTCYHYCAARLYFALTAWNKYVRGVYDRSQEIRPAVFHKFQQAILKEVVCGPSFECVPPLTSDSRHGPALLERLCGVTGWCSSTGSNRGVLWRKSPILFLIANTSHIPRTCGPSWTAGRTERLGGAQPYSLGGTAFRGLTSTRHLQVSATLFETFDVEMTLAPLPAPDAEWIIWSNMPEEQQRVEQLQLARFLARQTVAVTAKRLLAVKARMKTLAREIERRG